MTDLDRPTTISRAGCRNTSTRPKNGVSSSDWLSHLSSLCPLGCPVSCRFAAVLEHLLTDPLCLCLVVFYPAKYAPKYPIGYKAAIAFALVSIALTLVFRWLSLRQPTGAAMTVEQQEDDVMRHESDEETKTGGDMVKGELASVPTLRA